jgi:hypothetical protein
MEKGLIENPFLNEKHQNSKHMCRRVPSKTMA